MIKADSISIDTGGGIGPNPFINTGGPGVFVCNPLTCGGIGATCGDWSDSCGGIISCGVCGSGLSCDGGVCVAGGVTPPSPPGPSLGGYKNPVTENATILIFPTQINLKMTINTNNKQIITIKNNKNISQTLSISQNNLDNMVILGNSSITIAPGETKVMEIIFVAPGQTGIFTGSINIGNQQVLVSLDIKTKIILFDSNIVVLNRGYKVSSSEQLKTKITIVPMGDKERMDVILNYAIKDLSGKVYLTHSETVLIDNRLDLNRNFDVSSLSLGKYLVSLQLVYPNGVALSNAQFLIVKQTPQNFLGFVMFILIVAMIIVLIVIVAISIRIKGHSRE
jgi:hypothetical protein